MVPPIELRSDNAAGAAPEIVASLAAANLGSALAYGSDPWTHRLRDRVRQVFEHPTAEVFPVVSGTAANALALSALCPPWGAVLCHETAHILQSECAATSMFSGGGAMRGLPGADFRLTPRSLDDAFAATRWGDPHHSQPAAVSLTQPTDYGTIYEPAEISALADRARTRGLRVHVDGARLANALATLGCGPGATKNGALSADVIVCFDPALSEQLVYRVKRAGHVASKMRFQSAQLDAYLDGGLWLRLARQANAAMAHLASGLEGLGVNLVTRPRVNMLFARVDEAMADQWAQAGLLFHRFGSGLIRLVTSFQTTEADIDEALARIGAAMSSGGSRR
jgi:threonine aldolase